MLVALLLGFLAQSPQVTLSPGAPVRGSIRTTSPTLETERIRERWGKPMRAEPHALAAPPGTWTIELRAELFNAYLAVLDADGHVVAEDADGLGGTDARVVLELEPDQGPLTVWAVCTTSQTGPFELRLVEGDAPLPEREPEPDPITFLASLVEEHEPGTEAYRQAVVDRGNALIARRANSEAVELDELALQQLDPSNPAHELVVAWMHGVIMKPLLSLRRYPEAAAHGRAAMAYFSRQPEQGDQAVMAYNLAYALWQIGELDEGLHWSQKADEIASRKLRDAKPERKAFADLRRSFERATGHWESTLAGLGEPIVLRDGQTLERELRITNDWQHTAIVGPDYSLMPRYETLPIRVERAGTWSLDLRSFAFDTYLVLRDETGAVVAEDDDGRGTLDSRLVVDLDADRTYLLEPTALHNREGRYWLDVHAGRLDDRTPWQQREAVAAELEACFAYVDGGEASRGEQLRALEQAAGMLETLGHGDRRVEILERRLALMAEVFGPESPAVLSGREALAGALFDAGRTAEALPLLEEVRAAWVELRGTDAVPEGVLFTLARVRRSRGDWEQAEELLERLRELSLQRYGPESAAMRNVHVALGRLAAARERWVEAVEHGRWVADWWRGAGAAAAPGARFLLAGAVGVLADRQIMAEDFEGALASYEETIRLNADVYGERAPVVAANRALSAWVLEHLGQPERAIERWRAAQAVLEQGESGWRDDCEIIGAELLAARGEGERALELACSGVDRRVEDLARHVATLPEPLRLRKLASTGNSMSALLGIGAQVPGSERAVYERLLQIKGLVGRGLLASRARVREDLDPETRARVTELRGLQSELARAFHQGDEELLAKLRDRRVELEEQLALGGTAEEGDRRVAVAELARALPEGSVLVDLYVTDQVEPAREVDGAWVAPEWWKRDRVTAFVVRAGSDAVRRVELGAAEAIEGVAHDLGGALLAARGVAAAPSPAAAGGGLRRLLWDPIAPLVGDAPLVFVSSYGFLGSVPFEVLRREDGRFLVEDHAFVYLTDAASLVDAPAPEPVEDASLLLVGDVDYDAAGTEAATALVALRDVEAVPVRGPAAGGWPRLPGTAREIERVRGLAESVDATLLAGSRATEEAVKGALPGHAWVHFATHGFFEPEGTVSAASPAASHGGGGPRGGDPEGVSGLLPGLLSGLVLAGANGGPEPGRDDGLLTAEELTWLDLSACETGLGSARGAEGLIGLRRAFHLAGVRSVVSSLWSVEDEATSELMESFYRHLWEEGRGRSEALRAAQLELLAANRVRTGEALPWTWGAFVLSGEWR